MKFRYSPRCCDAENFRAILQPLCFSWEGEKFAEAKSEDLPYSVVANVSGEKPNELNEWAMPIGVALTLPETVKFFC